MQFRLVRVILAFALAALVLDGCGVKQPPHRFSASELATKYTAAWCSQDPAKVAAFYGENGSLAINGGAPAVGRAAITESARGFMTAFPDMVVTMTDLFPEGTGYVYRWSLTGTNTGPGGTGKHVRISGQENWQIGADGLIAKSIGSFDAAEYQRQLAEGAPPEPEPETRRPLRQRE